MDDPAFPDFRLRSLLALSREGGVTAAASALGLTQPAVSRHLEELEEGYGATLLEKKGRRLVPTQAGLALITAAERLEASYKEARREVAAAAGRRDYRIGATLTVAEFYLPRALAAFRDQRPEDGLRLVVANTSEIVRAVRSGELSFGVVEGPFDPEGLEHRLLDKDSLVAVGPPGKHSARRASLTGSGQPHRKRRLGLDEFLALPLILREKGSGTRAVLEGRLAELGRDPARLVPTMEIGSIGAIKALVAGGLGYTVISALAVEAELEAGRLERVEVAGMPIPRELKLLSLPGVPWPRDFAPFLQLAHRGPAG